MPRSGRRGRDPSAINAKVETAATTTFFRVVWKTDRAIVPPDGWYEWKQDEANPKIKQPYHITLRGGEPVFFAALGQFQRDGGLRAARRRLRKQPERRALRGLFEHIKTRANELHSQHG
ncbi:SOS response-associated peptidase [Stutzerimonas azotifigens]|uniref:SOS response-associated peptidase n=1 Tax=Stutzerimonas azotifigens TaxID=291995 RepID=UPI002159A90C|nr:SOS response-associated peptidase [Stutzerimonas azotifigens]